MKLLGLQIPNFTYPGVPDNQLFAHISRIATTAEDAGFDSLFVMDHFYQIGAVGPRTDPMLEAYTLLGGLAARTSKVRLATLVTGVTYRNPALLAKIVTTLDIVSAGRAMLGIGAAWNEEEHQGYGFAFPPIGERMDRLEEALRIARAMFREESATESGRYYSVQEALNFPRPVQPNGPPILIGGGGERRLLGLVARYADIWNMIGGTPDEVRHKIAVLQCHCDAVGRSCAEIVKTRLGALVIAPSEAEVQRKLQDLTRARAGMGEERLRSYVVAGTPEQVQQRVREYLSAGLDGMIFNMLDAQDLEPVKLAGETLRELSATGSEEISSSAATPSSP
jgi:F420-dependent oxidoreductase-like protein